MLCKACKTISPLHLALVKPQQERCVICSTGVQRNGWPKAEQLEEISKNEHRSRNKSSLPRNTEQERTSGFFFNLGNTTEERCLSQEVLEVLAVKEWLSVPSANEEEEARGLTLFVVLEGKEENCNGEE